MMRMPPKVKFQKEEIVKAALNVARKQGIDAVTAREVAKELGVSVGPIFTWFETMEQLKAEVYALAKARYREHIERGLLGPVPFLGVWQQYLAFARKEPELYRLLFLTRPGNASGGAMEVLRFSQELARPSIMRIYNMDADTADKYFRNIWLVAFSFATLVVTDDCPYTDEEMLAVGTEISLSICKAYKEVPGLAKGDFDRDAVFQELVKK
jgi:AcrR family transcriptional regulator